jgi:hypothetical protein
MYVYCVHIHKYIYILDIGSPAHIFLPYSVTADKTCTYTYRYIIYFY